MDSFSSPSGQRTLGLLGDATLQDMSMSLRNSTQNSSGIFNKPPIPSKQQSNTSQWSQQHNIDDSANTTNMSSWVDDDLDEDKENSNANTPSKVNLKHRGAFSQSRQNIAAGELTNVTSSFFNDNSYMMSLLPTDDENLMNESANLLQNSYIENTASKRQPLKANTSLNNESTTNENNITTAQDRIKLMMMMSQKRESNLKRSFTIGNGDTSFNNRSDTSQLLGNNTFTDKTRFNTSTGNESISALPKRIDFNETIPNSSKNITNTSSSSQSGLSSIQENLAHQASNGNRLASLYFRPDSSKLDASSNPQNPFDVSGMSQQPHQSFYNASLANIDASQFVSGNDYLDELEKDEQLNRKEFADNELTVMMNYKSANTTALAATPNSGNSSKSGSASNNNQTWISNATHMQQNSQLEISTNSSLNSDGPYSAKAALENNKKSVPVTSYFQSSSDLPDWVVNARTPDPVMTSDEESSSNSSSFNQHQHIQNEQGDKTICQEVEGGSESKNSSSKCDPDDITFSTPGSGRLADSASFSFTFNTSDSGSFIKKKVKDSAIDEQPTRDTQKEPFKPIKERSDKLTCETNLKTIQEELDRVASRFPSEMASQRMGINSSMSSNLSEPLMSSSVIKQSTQGANSAGSTTSSNNKDNGISSHLIMDETMSSIRSSDISAEMYKANSRLMNRHHYHQKENLSTNTSGMSSILSASKKTTTGSLTSTPSKLIKSKSESSHMELINDQDTVKRSNKKSSSGKLVSNKTGNTSPSSKLGPIEEKPSVSNSCINGSNLQIPNPSIRPLKMPSPVQHSMNEFMDNKSSRASISSTNSSSSTVVTPTLSSSSSSDITSSALSKISSLISNNHGSDLVPVVFLPFSSLVSSSASSSSLPHHLHSRNSDQHSIKSMHSNKSNFNDPNNISTGSDSNFISASESHQSNNLTIVSNMPVDVSTLSANLPQIELSKAEIDFGCIAEGCSTMARLNMNLNGKYNAVNSCYIQVELEDVKEWQIEPISDQGQVTSTKSFIFKRMEESLVKHLLGQPLGLTGGNNQTRRASDVGPHDSQASLADSTSNKSTAAHIQLDLFSRYHSFYVHLDLSKVNIYKSLMEDMKRRAETREELNTWLEPLRVRATLNVYYCVDLNNTRSSIGDVSSASFKSATSNMMNSHAKKIALKQTSVIFTLGYAKLKSGLLSTGIAELEILIDSHRRLKFQQQQESDKTLNDEDHEKTLVQTNETAQSHKRMLDRKYFPLINSGNINVSVACYLLKIGDSSTSNNRIKSLSQSVCLDSKTYEVHLGSDHVMELMANAKIKSYLKLMLENSDIDPSPTDMNGNKRQPANTKLVIQVMPNGVKFETPIYITYRSEPSLNMPSFHSVTSAMNPPSSTNVSAPPVVNKIATKATRPKLFATKSVLFFGRVLSDAVKNYYDEFNLNVSDDASFNCLLAIQDDGNDGLSGYFKLVNENDQEVDSLRVVLTSEPIRVRVKFVDTASNRPPFGLGDPTGMIKTAKLKVKTLTEPSAQSNIKLVSFVGFHANVTIQNAMSINSLQIDRYKQPSVTKLEELLKAKQIRHLKHTIELAKTYSLNKSVNLYRKVLKLAHSGHNYILLPFLFNLRSNQELNVTVGKTPTSNYQSTINLEYELIGRSRLTITLDTGVRVNFDDEDEDNQAMSRRVPWLEFKPSEGKDAKLVLSLQSSDSTVLDDICLVLFWFETDVVSYMCRTAQANMDTLKSSLNESKTSERHLNIVDNLYQKLIRVKRFASESHLVEDKRLSTASSMSSIDSDMSRLNTTASKTLKVINEELVRLFRQAMKCHLVKLTLDSTSTPSSHSINRFDEDSLEIANVNNTSNSSSFSSTILSKPSHVEHIIDNSVSMDHSGHLGNSTRHQISQFTIDSLCLTPHVNANIVQKPSSSQSSQYESTHIIPVDLGAGGGKGASMPLYEIKFPPISAKSQWMVELQLTNPGRTPVIWRGYSTGPALMTSNDDISKKFTMNKPVFKMTPASGSIGSFKSEMIKIEFKPADEISNALFSQNWHIDTRSNELTGWFSSKLNLVGKTTQATPSQTLRPSKGSESKLDYMTGVINSKTSSSLISSTSLSSLSSASSFMSSASTSSLPSASSSLCKVKMNVERCDFPDTLPNETSEGYIVVNNNELVECQLKIMSLKDPFSSKHTNMARSINPKHYVRIKVDFKPCTPGLYTDTLLIKIDRYPDVVLMCTLIGRCVAN